MLKPYNLLLMHAGVTWSMMISGHVAFIQGLAYITCQFIGAIIGAGITKGLKPASLVDPGCFGPVGVSHAQLFGMEFMAATILFVTVYGVAVSQKGAGNIGPLIIGLSLFAAAEAVGPYTGAALNTARVLGPAVIYGCHWDSFWIYLLAHLAASTLAAVFGLTTCPPGPFFVGDHLGNLPRLLAHPRFIKAVPWSTAADPMRKVDALTSLDPSLAPYAKGLQLRQKALRDLEALVFKPDNVDEAVLDLKNH